VLLPVLEAEPAKVMLALATSHVITTLILLYK
jgi:hypothetical protein